MTFVEVIKDSDAGVDGLQAARAAAVSPDGKHLYAVGSADNALSVFSRNATTGALTFIEVQQNGVGPIDGLLAAISVTMSPDGKHVYAAGVNNNAIAVFSRNSTTGALTFVQVLRNGVDSVAGLVGVRWVTVSPDGNHVYTASSGDSAVAVFARNSSTGELTFVEVQKDGVGTVDGLLASRSVTVSPDGAHVYATGSGESEVAVFSRNATTGALTWVEIQKDGVGLVDGLASALVATVSPDGKHVYVTGNADNGLAVFSRNATTGALTFVEVLKDSDAGVDGLAGAFPVVVSADGQHVYVGGSGGNEVGVFARNSSTGVLTFEEVHKNTDAGVDGLAGPVGLVESPDGAHLYIVSQTDSAIAVYQGLVSDLAITKTAAPTEVRVGQNLTYTLTVTNNGPDDATSLTITDTLPGTVAWVSGSDGCVHTGEPLGGIVICTAASLANGANVVFTITVAAPSSFGAISNTASVSATNPPDPTPANDSATAVTSVLLAPPVPAIGVWGLGLLALVFSAIVFTTRRRRASVAR